MKIKKYKKILDDTYISNFENSEGRKINRIIMLKRYTEPSENEVIEYLIKNTLEAEELNLRELEPENDFHAELISFSDNIRQQIKEKDLRMINFLKRNTPVPAIDDNEKPHKFLQLIYGILPKNLEDNIQRYEKRLSDNRLKSIGLGERLILRIIYDNTLLEKKSIDNLIENEVINSKTFNIYHHNCSKEELIDNINFLYKNFFRSKEINNLPDISCKILEQVTSYPINALKELNEYEKNRSSNIGLFGGLMTDNEELN